MTRSQRMQAILAEALAPSRLEIRDDSAKHAGHAGARAEGETHYHITVRSAAFAGLSRVAMHQKVYALLAGEFERGLHALGIDAGAYLISSSCKGED